MTRECAYRRQAHGGRIGPKVAAALTATSVSAIGSSTQLDLFALRVLALPQDKKRNVWMRGQVYVINPGGSASLGIRIVGDRASAHCMHMDEQDLSEPAWPVFGPPCRPPTYQRGA